VFDPFGHGVIAFAQHDLDVELHQSPLARRSATREGG
jgi:hypothetical protein